MIKLKNLKRKFQWYWFIKTNTSKVAKILIKNDPCYLAYLENNKVINDNEYISEAKALLVLINIYGGIKCINVDILHNLLYSVFCESNVVDIDLSGCHYINSVKELEQFIGTKYKYFPIAEEIYKSIS